MTKTAKQRAKKALELRRKLPKYKRFGLDEREARKLGVNSGVKRARQIINSSSLSYKDAVAVARFGRFLKRRRTPKIQGSIDLWGGEQFIKRAKKFVKRNR